MIRVMTECKMTQRSSAVGSGLAFLIPGPAESGRVFVCVCVGGQLVEGHPLNLQICALSGSSSPLRSEEPEVTTLKAPRPNGALVKRRGAPRFHTHPSLSADVGSNVLQNGPERGRGP